MTHLKISNRVKSWIQAGILAFILILLIHDTQFTNALPPSKFRGRQGIDIEKLVFGTDARQYAGDTPCHQDMDIMWKTKLESPSVSGSVIADLFHDGRKQIITAGMHFVDVVSATDGKRVPGWPCAFGWTSIIADPILLDIDQDGSDEIAIATMAGEIVFLNRYGEIVSGRTFKIPKLDVPKDWFAGLDSAVTYMSLADTTRYEKQKSDDAQVGQDSSKTKVYKGVSSKENPHKPIQDDRQIKSITTKEAWAGFEGWLTDDGLESLQLFLDARPLTEAEEMEALFSPQYAHWIQAHPNHHQFPNSDRIFIDAHIFDAPVVVDLDSDGKMELVVTVNYYFDDSVISKPGKVAKYPTNTDFTKYVACGVVAFSLEKEQIVWQSPLELTTDSSNHMARIYGSPTTVDLDDDGKLEVIVGTSVGSIYVLNNAGIWLPSMASLVVDSIGSSVAAEDVNGDGKLELIVTDDSGNVVCFRSDGTQLWENQVSSSVNHAPLIGDVDGDGNLDVVVVSTAGHIWMLGAAHGKQIQAPIKLGGMVTATPILVPLSKPHTLWQPSDGLYIMVHGLDGHIYIVEGKTGCYDKMDIGEPSSSVVLADDLTGNGRMDLLISTNEGHLYCISTHSPVSRLASSSATSRLKGRNGFTTGFFQHIRVLEDTRFRTNVAGSNFYVSFEIVDQRPQRGSNPHYEVILWQGQKRWSTTTYHSPGIYHQKLPTPPTVSTVTLKLELTNEHGQAFFDSWNVGFNQQWYRIWKWLVALPIAILAISILFSKRIKQYLP